MASSRRRFGLGGVVGVLVIGVGCVGDPSGSAAAPVRRQPPVTSTATLTVDDVRLESLGQERPALEDADRNLFRFEPKAAVTPPATEKPSIPSSRPPVVALPSGPPPPPPIPLRFIGLVDAPTQTGRLAILSDGHGNIFYGKDGAIIEGRYRVLKISPDAAELSYLDGRGTQTIRLTGQ